jgi:hypothetical protein
VPALVAQMAEHLPADLLDALTQFSELQKKGETIDAVRLLTSLSPSHSLSLSLSLSLCPSFSFFFAHHTTHTLPSHA